MGKYQPRDGPEASLVLSDAVPLLADWRLYEYS